MNRQFGKPIKDLPEKKYDIIIDSNGKTLMTIPEKIQLAQTDSWLTIVTTMLKDILDIVKPPQKGKGSFFKVLPETETGKEESGT